uniref:SKI/DACH domain containing 1 n=1 Tax=Myripristis murdjan TaxID=586833 RepID=A0A667XPE6_9TELE
MGDLECGFEEMQGVRLGYLLIKGKQMFALSQVFTDLLKNIPRTTVHKRMDHLKVKKHHCDLKELRKLKAINSIAFHAAKCTLISREDVEALYFSCKTERVLKSNKRKDASRGLLRADAGLWKEKVWFSLHGVPQTLALHNKTGRRRELTPCLPDSKLPQFYHKPQGRDYRSATKSSYKHFKNYETAQISGNRVTLSQRHSFLRSAASRQPVVLQSAIAAQSRLSRSAGDLLHKRKRRHFYLDPRPHHHHQHHHHHHHHHTYSDRANHDSDFGSGFSTTTSGSSDEEEEEDEDDTQSESSEVSSEEEESSSQSDSSSVSSRVSVQSIRFRRARVGSITKTLNTSKKCDLTCSETRNNTGPQPTKFISTVVRESFFTESKRENVSDVYGDPNQADPVDDVAPYSPGANRNKAFSLRRTPGHPNKCLPGLSTHCDHDKDTKLPKCTDKREAKTTTPKLPSPLKKIKTEAEEPSVTETPHTDSDRTARTPPFNLHNVKIKVEESCDEYEYQSQASAVKCKGDKADSSSSQYPCGDIKQADGFTNGAKAVDKSIDVAPKSPCGPQECRGTQDTFCTEEGEHRNKNCRTLVLGRKPRVSRTQTKQNVPRVDKAASSFRPAGFEGCTEDLPIRRKRSSVSNVASPAKKPFSLMANFPSPPSLVVGSDGDLCPAYSLNSLRAPGPPPLSHPVWRWQPGGQPLPPPHAQRTRKY